MSSHVFASVGFAAHSKIELARAVPARVLGSRSPAESLICLPVTVHLQAWTEARAAVLAAATLSKPPPPPDDVQPRRAVALAVAAASRRRH
uniref:Uncharacterized protein n=1 Tax=Oryza sativa subsp. japonica TaxID=39947 RepID=Q6K2X0_ORYSJ|nr:hypothetical protein [Oryza sativa Japonica Group]